MSTDTLARRIASALWPNLDLGGAALEEIAGKIAPLLPDTVSGSDIERSRELAARVHDTRMPSPRFSADLRAGELDDHLSPALVQAGMQDERARIIGWLDRGDPDFPWRTQDIANFIRMGCPELTDETTITVAAAQWRLVPVEPTDAMLQGACEKHLPGKPMSATTPSHRGPAWDNMEECPRFVTRRRIWASMIEAAPKP